MEEKITKKNRQEAAREKAQLMREAEAKKQKKKKIAIQASVVAGIFGAAACIVVLILGMTASKGPAMNPANTSGYGYAYTPTGGLVESASSMATTAPKDVTPETGKTTISVYVDYACPHCANFESVNGPYLDSLLKSGSTNVYYYPVAFLTKYSLNGANATACIADVAPQAAWDFPMAMFQTYLSSGQAENQYSPRKNEIADIALDVAGDISGDDAGKLRDCIVNGTYDSWVEAGTDAALKGPLPNSEAVANVKGTPTILVNGILYEGPLDNQATFQNFVESVEAGSMPESN